MDRATQLDAADPLRALRTEFHLPVDDNGNALTYLCGHSLGLQPRGAQALLQAELNAWQRMGVEAHFSGARPWVSYHEPLAQGLATLTGAHSSEVVAMNSLSVNLHLLLASFYRPTTQRHRILIERNAFPSDRYAAMSQIAWHGFDPTEALMEVAPRDGEVTLREEDVLALIEREGSTIATVLWPGVQYVTGQSFDIASITTAARKKGAMIGFDLAHAIGNVPLKLHDGGADFAVWCSYKYLNGGPGAIGGAFVHERHARKFDLPRLSGWWGHNPATRFDMPRDFAPQAGAAGWQVSNPPIFAMAPLLASLEIYARAGMDALRAKSLALTEFLRVEIAARLPSVHVLTPGEPRAHGSQLSLAFGLQEAELSQLREHLHEAGIVCDWRKPDVLRVAPVPLFNTFADARKLVATLSTALGKAAA